MENPGWYTAYTPYQAEIAQGRLEALINFQTLVIELTGMQIANASLLDEGTAAAEAVTMLHANRPKNKKEANVFLVDTNTFPQTIEVLKTRTAPIGIEIKLVDIDSADLSDQSVFGVFFQYPDNNGEVKDRSSLVASAKELGLGVAVASDLLALCLLTPPGKWGVDVVVGTAQRLGVPMDTADLTQHSLLRKTNSRGQCPEGLLVFPKTGMATLRIAWHFRRVSSI